MLKKILAGLGVASSLAVANANDGQVQQHRTTQCSKYGQMEFQFSISDKRVTEQDIKWLIQSLENWVAEGRRFKEGETLQLGWMILKIEKTRDQTLKLLEPDMKSFPVRFVDSMNATLLALRNQKDAVESVTPAPRPAFPSIREGVLVHPDYKTAKQLVLQRFRQDGNMSGWVVIDAADKSATSMENLAAVSLYQLALDRPDVVKFLAFPANYQILIRQNSIVVMLDGEPQKIRGGSYIHLLNAKK